MRIEDLPAELLKAAVIDDAELTVEQAVAMRHFLQRIGGTENALLAVELLEKIERTWVTSKP